MLVDVGPKTKLGSRGEGHGRFFSGVDHVSEVVLKDILVLTIWSLKSQPKRGAYVVVKVVDGDGVPALGKLD